MNNDYINPEEDKQHLIHLLKWLVDEVLSAGGDGDAIWLSEYYSVKDLYSFILRYNVEINIPSVWEIKLNDGYISLGAGQEGLLITNKEEFFKKNTPSWSQCSLRY